MRRTERFISVLLALTFIATAAAVVTSDDGGEGEHILYRQDVFLGDYAKAPVTEITGIPTTTTVGTLVLIGTSLPDGATQNSIRWSIRDAGDTGASIANGNELITTGTGTVTITAEIGKVVEASFGSEHTVAIKDDGTIWTWGRNNNGQLGNGTTENSLIPMKMGEDEDWAKVSAGNDHTIAVKTDGTLWAWGGNVNGQLGIGTTENSLIPVQIGEDDDWTMISAGHLHATAMKADGTIWAWGYNMNGQLGIGTTAESHNPVQIGEDDDWTAVSAGWLHTMAIKDDGTLWAWGSNLEGQLGTGTQGTITKIPEQVGSDDDWMTVSAGGKHTVAIKDDGTLWAWGVNDSGQLGIGEGEADSDIPIRIGTDDDWTMISAGQYHNVAAKDDGTLWVWGYNQHGQFGNGTKISCETPTQMGIEDDWTMVSAGYLRTMMIKDDGTLWACGSNSYGQLGDGTKTNSYTMTQITYVHTQDFDIVVTDVPVPDEVDDTDDNVTDNGNGNGNGNGNNNGIDKDNDADKGKETGTGNGMDNEIMTMFAIVVFVIIVFSLTIYWRSRGP